MSAAEEPATPQPSGDAKAWALPGRLVANMLGTYGAVALAGLSALVVTPVVIHHLGKDAYGVYSLMASLSAYLLLLNLGFGTATVKLVAEDAGRRPDRVIQTFNTTFFALCLLGTIALVIGTAVGLLSPRLFSIPAPLRHQTVVSFELLAVTIAASVPASAVIGVVMGYQRYDLQGIVDSVGIVAVGLGTIGVVLAGSGLIGISAVTAGGTLLMTVVPWFVVRRLVPGIRLSPRLLERSRLRQTTVLSGWYLVQNLTGILNTETDLVVVGVTLGVRNVALFAVGAQLALLADKGISPFQRVFFPHISALSATMDSETELHAVLFDGTRAVLCISVPVSLVLMLLAGPAVQAWVGGGFSVAAQVVTVMTAAGLMRSFATVAAQLFIGLGRARAAAVIGTVTAVVNLVVSVALAQVMGTVGVAVGTAVAVGLVYLPASLLATRRLIHVSITDWVKASVWPHVLPAAGTAAALLGLRAVCPGSPLPVVGCGVLACAIYWTLYVLVGATPAERAHLRGLRHRRSAA